MAHKVIILYRLYMPYYFLGTFTEYPYKSPIIIPDEVIVGLFLIDLYHSRIPCFLLCCFVQRNIFS